MIPPFPKKELANCITHGVGLVLSIVGLIVLVDLALVFGGSLKIASCIVFSISLVLLYGSSATYHYYKKTSFNRILKTIDHSAIYVLIAGTYTPIALVTIGGSWGWTLFGIVWGLCLIGIIFKIFFVHRFKILSPFTFALYLYGMDRCHVWWQPTHNEYTC